MAISEAEQARHDAAMAKRRAERERLEQSTEAFQNALKKTFKGALKDEEIRSKIHQETQNGKRGLAISPEMDRIRQATKSGNGAGIFGDLDAVETGFEKRYWETEED